MKFEEAKEYINSHPKDYLKQVHNIQIKGNENTCCPICGGSPTAAKFSIRSDNKLHCFACGFHGDVLELIAYDNNKLIPRDFKDVVHIGCDVLHLLREEPVPTNKKKIYSIKPRRPVNKPYNFTSIILQAHQMESETEYFHQRGFSDSLIQKYKLGYSKQGYNQLLTNFPKLQTQSRQQQYYKYVIPVLNEDNTCNYFMVRATEELQEDKYNHKIRNMKNIDEKNPIRLFNDRYMSRKFKQREILFIVEGWADALSLEELGQKAIALNSTSNCNKFLSLYKKHKPNYLFAIVMDKDEAGRKAKDYLIGEMRKQGAKVVQMDITENYKDINEFFVKDRQDFNKKVKAAVSFLKSKEQDTIYNSQKLRMKQILDTLQNIKSETYSWDDKGNGKLFADIYKNYCRYNVTAKEWYRYNGKNWEEDTGGMIVSRYAKELSEALLKYTFSIDDEEKRNSYRKHVINLGKLKYRKTMIEDAKECYYISTSDLDKDLFAFNCQNGVMNLRTFEFREHKADDLLSKISNVYYDVHATSEDFERFYDQVLQGNEEKKNYLQKLLGYAMTGDTKEESAYILYGATTRNGKSTLVSTIDYLLGGTNGYSMNVLPETLAMKKNKDSRQASGDIARLDGCRFLNMSEPPKRMIFDVALFKTLLGRDSITARHLREKEFEFLPVFKLFFNTNFLPIITDDSVFSSNRIYVITFERHFEPKEQDKGLKNRLKTQENISGIFNWCLQGLKLYYEEGVFPPKCIVDATADYRSASDKIGNFIQECLEESYKNCKAKDVYEDYQEWCKANGYGVENKGNFFDDLKSKGLLSDSGKVEGVSYKNVVKGYEIGKWKVVNSSFKEVCY